MVLIVWMLGSAVALTREKGQPEREVGGGVPTDEGGLGSWEFIKGTSSWEKFGAKAHTRSQESQSTRK